LTVARIATESSAGAALQTLPAVVRRWGRERPGKRALSDPDEELGYGDLDALVCEAAGRLARAGIRPGERLALLGENSSEWVILFLAGLSIGAVIVPLNVRLAPVELRRQLALTEPRLLLAAEELVELVERVTPPASIEVSILNRGSTDARTFWRRPRMRIREALPQAEAPALIAFTSGTTAAPKGAVIPHGALVRSATAFIPRLATSPEDSTLVLVPLFHNTGFVDQLSHMLLVGGAVDLLPRFHASAAVEALARRPATYLIAVPSIFRLLMLHERADDAFRSCRIATYGGASMPAAWIVELAARWPALQLYNCYGLTEFTSVSHLLDPEHALTRGDSVGSPVEGVRQRVVGDGLEPLPDGEVGEVWLAGPMRMAGYWRSPAATRAALHGDWLRTGDLGQTDGEFLVVLGRSAEVINRGGEKIYVSPVEAALSEVPEVAEAAVVGAPHPILQERVVAWIVPRPGAGFDEHTARRHLAERVADYAVPEAFLLADELPRNAAGKIDRAALRTEAASQVRGEEP
jgi:acyl-CoA synthetase (AMP-forming)/AMP-acid ligase II